MPLSRLLRTLIALAGLSLLSAACREIPPSALPAGPGASDRPDLRIAFVGAYGGSTDGPATRAFEGARLAFDEANEDQATPADLLIISINTQSDAAVTAEAVAEKIVADPEVVAVIGWPSVPESAELAAALSAEGIAYLDVAPTYGLHAGAVDAVEGAMVPRRQMVPDDDLQAEAIATTAVDVASGQHGPLACLAGDVDPRGQQLQGQVARHLDAHQKSVALVPVEPGEEAYPEVAAEALVAGCRVLVWTGGGTDGAVIRLGMDEVGLEDIPIVGADVMRNDAYVADSEPSGDGTVTACSCAQLPDSAGVDLQSFIQAYQSRYGGVPGTYSMEGWDAGQILVTAVASGATTRAQIAEAVATLASYEGLAGTYDFDDAGDLLHARKHVTLATMRANRWVPGVE